jgi:splicing factor 3B subunit 3
MANTQATQAFYSLTLEAGSAPTAACLCNVIPGLKATDQQIFEARGERVYLRRLVNNDQGEVKAETVLEQDVFSIIRGVGAFKIPGTKEDLLAISSDSGRMVMLRYNAERNRLDKVHLETFGKSGIRRTVPGQYLSVDPRGRCLMLSSIEKNKVVYIFQRTIDGTINISSPHEANQAGLLCYDTCALDTGWEHPVFAALEVDYTQVESDPETANAPDKHLNYYTVDLGLNHVAKSWSGPCDPTANKIFTVPGGQEGPSGVIICAEGRLYYMHKGQKAPLSIPIPERQGALEQTRKRYIVGGCMFSNKSKRTFFLLLQTDDGDVFKLTMDMEVDDRGRVTNTVQALNLRYFDTLPVARQMMLIKKGYLYVVAESGPSMVYHVDGLAEDDDFEPWNSFSSSTLANHEEPLEPLSFKPREELHNLSVAGDVPSLHPLTRTDVDNLTGEDMPQIYAIQGKGDKSVFKTIRHGMSVEDIISSPMGNVPYDQIWSMKRAVDDQWHYYVLLSSSYTDRTTVLGIGDDVETLEDTAFITTRATITACQMGENSHVQVHARGVRTIHASGKVDTWDSPAHRTVVAGAANQRQLLLGLSSGELAFFFMDQNGALNALEEYPEMSDRVTAIGIGATPKGQQQAKYGVVGCEDRTIRVLSTDIETPLEPRSVQALSDVPVSIEVVEMIDPSSGSAVNFVHIGLKSGLYLRAIIDEATGELSDVRSKFLGHKPVRIFPIEIEGQQCVLCCSSRPWLGFHHPITKQYTLTPLVTGSLTAAAPFISEHISGLCGIIESELR